MDGDWQVELHYNARMATLRRILKYTPAVVLGLLLVAWSITLGWNLTWITRSGGSDTACTLRNHSIHIYQVEANIFKPGWYWDPKPSMKVPLNAYAYRPPRFAFQRPEGRIPSWKLEVPIPILLAVCLPLTIGPFISFRFRLWHYLAYMALVAFELAYFLHWQE